MDLTILSTISYCKKFCTTLLLQILRKTKRLFIKGTWWTNHRTRLAYHIALTTISTNEVMMTLPNWNFWRTLKHMES
jgi:hypothetical protein